MIVRKTNRYLKDVELLKKRHCDLSLLDDAVEKLSKGEKLPPSYRDHSLSGQYSNCRECHIKPDWLLVYYIDDGELILFLLRTGTHSDLF